jgi:monothiol glutaredoxin
LSIRGDFIRLPAIGGSFLLPRPEPLPIALPAFAAYIVGQGFRHESAAARFASPKGKTEGKTAMSIDQFIDNEVKSNDVVLFMKGTPQFPMCGFSGQVVQILDYLGVPYKGLNVLENDDLRGGIKTYSNWPTIPQLYVKGEFVGGCDIIREMFQAGELQSLFKDNGIAVKEAAQV